MQESFSLCRRSFVYLPVLGCVSAKLIYCYKYLLVSFLSTFSFHKARRLVGWLPWILATFALAHIHSAVRSVCRVCFLAARPPARSFAPFCCILFSVIFIESCSPTSRRLGLFFVLLLLYLSSFTGFTRTLCKRVLCYFEGWSWSCCCPSQLCWCFLLSTYFCDIIAVTAAAASRSPGESFCIN